MREDTLHLEDGQGIKVKPRGTKVRMTLKSGNRHTDYTPEQEKIGWVLQQGIAEKTKLHLKKICLRATRELEIGSGKRKEDK